MTGCKALAFSLGLVALAASPAAAQSRASALATATVIDLSETRANLQAATSLTARITGRISSTGGPVRRDSNTSSILIVAAPYRPADLSSRTLLVTITYW